MGGNKGKIFERIARDGQGWFVPGSDIEEIKGLLDQLRQTCDTVGRDYSEIEITVMWPGQGGADAIGALEGLGAHRAVIPLQALGENPAEGMERLAQDVISA